MLDLVRAAGSESHHHLGRVRAARDPLRAAAAPPPRPFPPAGSAPRRLRTARPLSNKRLKLTAPGIYGKIPFVIIHVRRRSLGAVR